MNVKFGVDVPSDVLIVDRSDLKSVMREILDEIQTEQVQDDILNIKEAAAYMKVSVPTVRALIKKGDIPHFQSGQVIRLNRFDLLEWMTNKKK